VYVPFTAQDVADIIRRLTSYLRRSRLADQQAREADRSEEHDRAAGWLPIAKDVVYAVPTALEVLLEWEAVMLVTVTEAYVQDVRAFAAERDAALMKDSDQTATYHEVSQAQSVTDPATELRRRWARNFLGRWSPPLG
jgi:hypothetical protein